MDGHTSDDRGRESSSSPLPIGPWIDDYIDQVADYAIIALDPQGTIESWNLGAHRVKGYTEPEAIGESFAMFYSKEDQRAGLPMRLLLEARDRGRVKHTGWRVRKDGSRFWGDVVITAVHNDTGHLTGFTKVTRDRSDLKALQDAQDSFYASFTHDFRTPVAALTGFLEALREADDQAERDALISRVEANAERLLRMVEGLVEFAQQRGDGALMLIDDIDIAAVARKAVGDLSPSLTPRRVQVPADAVAIARANGVAMERVVTNLVVNALKYSPESAPVEVEFSETPQGSIEMRVRDQGRGIDPEDLPTIFDRFTRGRLAEHDGGTGLGLASVRELVEQQGGQVSIESQLGIGTTVTIELRGVTPV